MKVLCYVDKRENDMKIEVCPLVNERCALGLERGNKYGKYGVKYNQSTLQM
jgi:hypothetical protein